MMLMAQALTCVIVLWDQGLLSNLPEQLLKDKVLVVLFQALTRTLHTQNPGGSWGNPECRETTAYAILTLGTLASLPFADALRLYTESAIEEGRAYLSQADDKLSRPDYLWVEKVTYGSNALSQAYILASLKASPLTYKFGPNVEDLCNIPMKNVARFTKFYTQLPLFANTPEWQIQASLLEGYLFLPQLRRVRLDIFPRSDMEEDKYFEYIPFTWTGSNNLDGTFLGANFLYEMMIISFLNYQADEYMEAVVGTQFSHALNEVKDLINRIFHEVETKDLGVRRQSHQEQNGDTKFTNGTGSLEANGNHIPYAETDIMTVYKTLKRFVEYVLNHPEVMTASPHDQRRLRHELKVFLLAHVDQIEDNSRFSQQEISPSANTTFQTPRGSFFDWVRSTSSDHTSCPYAFAFVTCLFGHGRDFFRTTEEKYIAQDLCRHLATMCRMYNDYGSLVRDRLEKNLNSVNFPEFGSAEEAGTDTALKDRLFRLADYERRCLDMALAELRKAGRGDTVGIVKMFCNVTDTYGQIYVLKDIASRMVKDKETDA